MATYPILILPKALRIAFQKKDFPRPIEPRKPNEPKLENNLYLKIIVFLTGVILLFFKPIVAVLLLTLAILWVVIHPEKKQFQKEILEYQLKLKDYEELLTDYNIKINLPKNTFDHIKRKESVLALLKSVNPPEYYEDYKKGKSHNYFYKVLKQHFGERVMESGALLLSFAYQWGEDWNGNEKKPFVADFVYFERESGLCIAIEIDEPYTLSGKSPIHLGDNFRDDFFSKNNWIVARFAEEQVVRHPHLCCELISKIALCVMQDPEFSYPFMVPSEIPVIPCWTKEEVLNLIKSDYRNQYLPIIDTPDFREDVGYSIANIKQLLGLEQLKMVRQHDVDGNKTPWVSHWEKGRRIRVTMNQDVIDKISANLLLNLFRVKKQVIPATESKKEYVLYIISEQTVGTVGIHDAAQ